MENNTLILNNDAAVLRAAYRAWLNATSLRQRRQRNKRFTYGDQWGDITVDRTGRHITEWEKYCTSEGAPITNNLLRQLVKTIVGRFRARYLNEENLNNETNPEKPAEHIVNPLDELDSRLLEEFLISGYCIQRIDDGETVHNVNPNMFFVNATHDPLGRDCEIVGQLHDLSLAELLSRTAQGSRKRAAMIRRLYSNDPLLRAANFASAIGATEAAGEDFWRSHNGKCRAIEVWTLESQEAWVCHNRVTGERKKVPISEARKAKTDPDIDTRWDIITSWHCRWFSPMGELLCHYTSPFNHGGHPFVFKFYPLTDGEVHSFIEDVIDQQKYVNRLITLVDHIMAASAKGVLLFPDSSLPDGFTWDDVRQVWRNSNGILPYSPGINDAKPEQISVNATNIGAYDMIQLQMKLLDNISGVSGALQGREARRGDTTSLYLTQVDNAAVALTDIFDTFNSFRHQRTTKLKKNIDRLTPPLR